jgi:signal transduction histidine kinase
LKANEFDRLEIENFSAKTNPSFNMMLARLADAWENQRQFVGNVSHELRTPLTVVVGYLQSVLRRSTNLNDYPEFSIALPM